VQERYSPQAVFKRLQRHLPSWLEQLPQLPDAVLESLQHARGPDPQTRQLQQRTRLLERELLAQQRLRKRHLLAGLAGLLALLLALPDSAGQLLNLPAASWALAAVAVALLWPRRIGP
jgi:ubiquinone biosynthesis protein